MREGVALLVAPLTAERLQWAASAALLFLFRPPFLRGCLPTAVQNIISRVPTQDETIW